MTENIDPFGNDMAQLKALMQVIDEISKSPIPLVDTADVVTNRNIRNLERLKPYVSRYLTPLRQSAGILTISEC